MKLQLNKDPKAKMDVAKMLNIEKNNNSLVSVYFINISQIINKDINFNLT